MSRKTDWINECIKNYIYVGFFPHDANIYENALKEEIEHGGVVDIWEPTDAIVRKKCKC